jgi:hypothetical protein
MLSVSVALVAYELGFIQEEDETQAPLPERELERQEQVACQVLLRLGPGRERQRDVLPRDLETDAAKHIAGRRYGSWRSFWALARRGPTTSLAGGPTDGFVLSR